MLLTTHQPNGADLASVFGADFRWSAERRRFAKYSLIFRVQSGLPDTCYYARLHAAALVEAGCFLRIFSDRLLTPSFLARVQARARSSIAGIECTLDLGHDKTTGMGFLVSDCVEGASVAEIGAALSRRNRRLPWTVALLLYHDAINSLREFHLAGFIHGAIRPAVVRIGLPTSGFTPSGVVLCHGMRLGETSHSREDDYFDLARTIFPLAARDQDDVVCGMLARNDPKVFARLVDVIAEEDTLLRQAAEEVLLPEVGSAAVRSTTLEASMSWDQVHQLWEEVARLCPPRGWWCAGKAAG